MFPKLILGRLLTIEQIMEFEKRLHNPLPDDYRDFLLQYNGGYFGVEEECYTTEKYGPILTHMFSIGSSELEFDLERFHSKPAPYCYLFPFGDDCNGNPMLISLGDENYGKVYGWNHECEEEEEELPNALYYCADSFHDFMLKLIPWEW